MEQSTKQNYGIKYPFTSESEDLYFLDLNTTIDDSIKSQLLHVLFTPKKQRLRMPDFGTDLIRYIFEPDDSISWSNIKDEIKTSISRFVPRAILTDINVFSDADSHQTFVQIFYDVKKGSVVENNEVVVKI